MLKAINVAGRALGAVCGVVLAGIWAYALWVPAAGLTALAGISVVTALLLVALGVFASVASVHGHGAVVALLFLASFFPVGAFVMPTEHWLKWVGWLDLGLLVAALMMWLTRKHAVLAQ
jgi:hypothetical protein